MRVLRPLKGGRRLGRLRRAAKGRCSSRLAEVLRLRKAPLAPLDASALPPALEQLESTAAKLKKTIKTDRDLLDKVRSPSDDTRAPPRA